MLGVLARHQIIKIQIDTRHEASVLLQGLCSTSCSLDHVTRDRLGWGGGTPTPATSDSVQILNTGSRWVCLISTISTTPGTDTVKIFDSMYQKPNSITVECGFRMLMSPGSKVTFINKKVQRQVDASDCGLFSLAFATDLCHGLDALSF